MLAVLGGLATGTGRTGSATHSAVGGPVQVLLVLAPHVGLLAVLTWRARAVSAERNVWARLAIGVGVMTATVLLGSALELVPATRAVGRTVAL